MSFYFESSGVKRFNLAGVEVSVFGADRQPCPVCGHPTGDCVGDLPTPEHVAGMGPIESLKHAQTVYVEEDIWVERVITGDRTTRVLKHAKGSTISREEAENLGLI